jgi:hypothetical protein
LTVTIGEKWRFIFLIYLLIISLIYIARELIVLVSSEKLQRSWLDHSEVKRENVIDCKTLVMVLFQMGKEREGEFQMVKESKQKR